MFESLEFVQDHEVGLEGRDTDLGEHRAKLTDERDLHAAVIPRYVQAAPPESLAQLLVSFSETFSLSEKTTFERLCEVFVDALRSGELFQFPAEVAGVLHVPLEEVHWGFVLIRPYTLEKVIEEDPFLARPHTAPQGERGTGVSAR